MIRIIRSKLGVILPVLLLGTALLAQGNGLAGQWVNSRVDGEGKTHVTTYTFNVQGNTFTGNATRTIGEKSDIIDGKIDGNKISFTERWSGHERTIESTGVIEGGKLTLAVENGPNTTKQVVAMRKKAGK